MGNDFARFRALLLTCACCSLGGVACSGSPEYGDAPLASGAQFSWDFVTRAPTAYTLVVLVDDTPAGAGLRDALAQAFDDADTEMGENQCFGAIDPAAWHPIDRSVVFVHPSTPGAAGFSSPAQDPALRLQSQQRYDVDRAPWLAAVRAGLDARPAAPGAAFQALAALADAESLLDGARPPESAAEVDVLNALPAPQSSSEVLALATEDESPGEASQYLPNPRHERLGAVLPAAEQHEPSECGKTGVPTTPRYQAFSARAQAWPCENPDFFGGVLWFGCGVSASVRCLPQPFAVDAGIAQCRAIAKYPGSEPCPTELGWLDPLDAHRNRTPRIDGSGSSATRVCEIRQLEGPALTACANRLDCADCEPGWCATEVPELIRQEDCPTGSVYAPVRFVLGAGEARNAQVTMVCNEAPR